jgi:nucleoside-diphosphate-sugar epimerase
VGTVSGKPVLLLTGAAGFLGRAVAAEATAAGWQVRAIVRQRDVTIGDERVVIDLAAPDARTALDDALEGVECIVHAAAATGNDKAHARGTVQATRALVEAALARADPPRLVLLSSIAVYNYASMPPWTQLDEMSPLEPESGLRDAYCRAKLAQESIVRQAAQHAGLNVWVLRPGTIVGAGREWTARLGFRAGPVLALPGGAAPVPLIAVDDCARAVIVAAGMAPSRSDYPIIDGHGCFEAVNLIGESTPSQAAYAAHLARSGWPRRVLSIPHILARAPARALALVGILFPGLVRLAPGPLRVETFDARFKPLRFSTARARDRLGFVATRKMAPAVAGEETTS